MENLPEKLNWLLNDFPSFVKSLDGKEKGKWGVMNAQQMTEHMSGFIRQGNGHDVRTTVSTPPELLEKFRVFLMSEKPFRENTRNAELPESALPENNASMKEALDELQLELDAFKNYFENNPNATLINSIFGELNRDQWIQLLHKHAMHHARQFGMEV